MSEYKDYGYQQNRLSCAHTYLLDPIKCMLSVEKNKCILDLGCGNGALANKLIEEGYNVYGLDASETGIRIANQKNGGRFFIQDLSTNELPSELKAKNFDTIISTEVIEHLYQPRSFVGLCKTILEKSSHGDLILSTPYHGYLKNLVMSLTGKMDHHFTALWDGGHIKFWSKYTLTTLLQEQGFRVEQFEGTGRLPYLWKSMVVRARLQ